METGDDNKLMELMQMMRYVITLLEQFRPIKVGGEEWLDNNDMCRMFKITERTLYRWKKLKYIKSMQIGGKTYYLKSAIVAMLGK